MRPFQYRAVGAFDEGLGAYRVERIPRPLEACAVVERDLMSYSVRTGYDVRADCPKCFEVVRLHWREETSQYVMEDSMVGSPMAVSIAVEAMKVAENAMVRATRADERAWLSERAFRAIQVTKAKRATRKRRRTSQRGRR